MPRETKTVRIPTGSTLYLDMSAWNLLVALVRSLGLKEAPLDEVVNRVSWVLSPTSAEMTFLERVKFLQDSESTPLTVVVSSETMEFCATKRKDSKECLTENPNLGRIIIER